MVFSAMTSNSNVISLPGFVVDICEDFYDLCLCFVGLELMKTFRVEVNDLEAARQELANAEKLFDLPITMYPNLLEVQKQMKGLEMIYGLYEEQKVGS
jgi:hypothetical protein